MKLISHDDYTIIRNSLCSSTPKIIKTGIQEMLNLFECGLDFPRFDRKSQQDFHSYIFKILKNSDYDIRKWMYHLLCVYDDPINLLRLIDASLANIEIEAQQSIENISWIVAVCGAHADSKQQLDKYLKQGNIFDYLTGTQIEIAASAFREQPLYNINKKILYDSLMPDDAIGPIWITKIYANQFKYFKNSNHYFNNHGEVSNGILSELLNHTDDVVRKYSMWAYAQDIKTWQTPVRLENIFSLESGVLKWNLVKLFQNGMFLNSHPDFIQEISSKINTMTNADKEGIILGCKKLGYSDSVAELLIDWEQSTWENNENLLLGLYSYFAKFSNRNPDYFEVTRCAFDNMNDLPENIQKFYQNFKKTKEGEAFMDKQINNFYGNTQVVYGGHGTQIINDNSSNIKDELIKEIRKTQDILEQKEISIEEFADFKNHIIFELEEQHNINNWINENPQIQTIIDKLDNINNVDNKNIKTTINDVLSTLANIVTILSVTQSFPQIVLFFNNIVSRILEFLS